MLSLGLGPAATLGGAGADKIAIDIVKQYANIKAPGAGAGVGPPFAEFRDHEIATGPITADATSDPRWVHGPPLPMPIAIAPRPFGLRPPTGIAARHPENAVNLAGRKHLGAVPGSSAHMS